jgi:FMN phosphatase YigB (HAD superfamily)
MKKAILFDLDGTLLPVDMEQFIKAYFKLLTAYVAPYGYTPEALVPALWKGTHAMMKNDGSISNEALFWKVFAQELGPEILTLQDTFETFYCQEFHKVKTVCGENSLAKTALETARKNGRQVVLATNPLFPKSGMETRLNWLGLTSSQFDLVTSYETDSFAKPSPAYYQSILARLNLRPQDCLMVGNDEKEDLWAAGLAGIDGYLVDDFKIPDPEHPFPGPHGDFTQMVDFLAQLD